MLTSNEYVEMVREKDRKEKEASEMKQRRKEERERKKMEKEKERERKKAERGEKKKGRGKGKGKCPLQYSSGEDEQEIDLHQPKSHRTRSVHAPERTLQRVRAVTLYAFCATQGSPLLPPVGCFGLTATIVASGLTHTVHWAATQLHHSLCVKNAVSYTEYFYVHEICFSNIVL